MKLLLASCFLITGVGLIIGISTHIPLLLLVGLLLLYAVMGGWIVSRRLTPIRKRGVKDRLLGGLIGGVFATTAYDLSRYLLILLFPFSVKPFEAIPLFGKLLIGPWVPSADLQLFAGIFYHLINGIGFGIAYSILFAPRGWIAGLLWALGLEALMLAIYPGWLNIKMMEEFFTVSVSGHLVYGVVLGILSRWYWKRSIVVGT